MKKNNKLSSVPIGKINNPHDRLFQSMLSHPEVARDLFEAHLPEEIKSITALNQITLCPRTFISKRFRKYEADIIYSTEMNHKPAYLYILVEAQSTVDKEMPFRLLCYLVEIMRHHREKLKNKDLPLVYPMVFYTGKKDYHGPRTLQELFQGQEALVKSVLIEPFHLIEAQHIPEESLKTHRYAGLLEAAYQCVQAEDVTKKMGVINELLKEVYKKTQVPFLRDMLYYLAQVLDDAEFQIVEESLDQLFSEEVSMLKDSFAHKCVQQGMQQGVQQGVQEGIQQERLLVAKRMIEKGYSLELVAELTDLSTDELKQLTH